MDGWKGRTTLLLEGKSRRGRRGIEDWRLGRGCGGDRRGGAAGEEEGDRGAEGGGVCGSRRWEAEDVDGMCMEELGGKEVRMEMWWEMHHGMGGCEC